MKERVVIYVSADALRALDLLKSWLGAKSRGSLVEALVDWAGREWGEQVTAWAIRRWAGPHDQERREDENHD